MARDSHVDTDDQAYIFFVQESGELLKLLESGLMSISQTHDTQTIHSLMRAAHSIKGGAACVGLTTIQDIAHDLENGIRALYKEETDFDIELENILLDAFDCLRAPIIKQIQTEEYDADAAKKRAEPIFERLEQKLGHPLEEASEYPEVEMAGDITAFIFAEEIPQGLSRLENLIKKPPAHNPNEEIKSQIEVLATLGDMLALSGFTEIAHIAMAAIDAHPDATLEIAQLALDDFLAGQESVIEGDRTQGGEPSAALKSFLDGHDIQRSSSVATILEQQEPAEDSTPFRHELETLLEFTSDGEDENHADIHLSVDDLAGLIIEDDTTDPENGAQAASAELSETFSLDDLSALQDLAVDSSEQMVAEKQPESIVEMETSDSQLEELHAEVELNHNKPVAASETAAKLQTSTSVSSKSTVFTPSSSDTANTKIDTNALSIRLEMGRLNQINNLVGELVTQDNSFLLRNKQDQVAIDALRRWFNHFNKITGQFQQYTKDLAAKNPQARSQLAPFASFAATMMEEMAQLSETIEDTKLLNQQDQQGIKQRQQTLKQLEHTLIETRMLPIGDLMGRFPRTVRDLSVSENKPVKLNLEGTNTLVDRALLAKLYDPLVHLVRNAFDHGIDSSEERTAQGKPAEGQITMRAYNRGNSTYVEVIDDGRGINLAKIREKAIRKNIISAQEAASLSKNQLYELIFAPGFSTAEKTSHISGRGVGLDAVRLQIHALKGNISLTSEEGKGTTFTLRLPWSMTITKLLIFRCQESFLGIPVNSLAAIASSEGATIQTEDGQSYYLWQGERVPLVQDVLTRYNYPSSLISSRQQSTGTWDRSSTWSQAGKQVILMLKQGNDLVGIKVEQILLEQDLVIKPFGTAIQPPTYLSACTVLGDGRLVPVIDANALIEQTLYKSQRTAFIDPNLTKIAPKLVLPTVLAIDDSLTTRQTLATTLQKAGYRIIQAQDGADGLQQLEQHPETVGIICDVEMPHMNGFEFLGRCRKKHSIDELPILMLTSRGSKRYRQLAKQLGANGYLTKPYLDKELIDTLQEAIAASSKSD